MDASIGAFEAKAQLSRLPLAVEKGERFTITLRGRPVADLEPHGTGTGQGVAAALAALRSFPRIRGVSDAEVASFVAALGTSGLQSNDPTSSRSLGACPAAGAI
jgi:antitoxin (DNA-binding transcriptional repressor) of toxin-antitoxin stability system